MQKRASITVEASIILPLAIAIMLFGITGALYLHDINVSLAHMQEITSYGRMLVWSEQTEEIKSMAGELKKKGKLGATEGSQSIEVTGNKIIVREEAVPKTIFSSWFSNLGWKLFPERIVVEEDKVINPMKLIRKCRLLEHMGEEK